MYTKHLIYGYLYIRKKYQNVILLWHSSLSTYTSGHVRFSVRAYCYASQLFYTTVIAAITDRAVQHCPHDSFWQVPRFWDTWTSQQSSICRGREIEVGKSKPTRSRFLRRFRSHLARSLSKVKSELGPS